MDTVLDQLESTIHTTTTENQSDILLPVSCNFQI